MTDRRIARQLAADSLAQGEPLAWFEALYREAAGNETVIPWADMRVNPNLADWLESRPLDAANQTALVIGCGLGDDAEALHRVGFDVTAFDISPTCVGWCRQRFPGSSVRYVTADLFEPPEKWQRRFDFVLEIYTLQVLPPELRSAAMHQIAGFVAPGGQLLVIARGRDETDDPGQMPWPLLRTELVGFSSAGLKEVSFEDYRDREEPPVRRFRVEFCRA